MALIATILGLVAILLGNFMEGGHLLALLQIPALVIVFGGTAAATLLSFSWFDIRHALRRLTAIYHEIDQDHRPLISEIVAVAALARKEGLLAVEAQRSLIKDPDLGRSLKYLIDGMESQTIDEILQLEMDQLLERENQAAKVWDTAGGYAPTIGIIGAVLGLIHVMQNLDKPELLGSGIAVAFVATIYGVTVANLFFLPWASKLRSQAQQRVSRHELIRAGILGILDGLNPQFLQQKLQGYLSPDFPWVSNEKS